MKITKPTLLIDEEKCRNNIRLMAKKAKNNNVIFRPHFKTHQSHIVSNWFRDEGVSKITVSSVSMAKYFIEDGWYDITIAFPFNVLEINDIINISTEVALNLVLESIEVFNFLCSELTRPVNYYIKIDIGYHRTGLQLSQIDEIINLIQLGDKEDKLNFKGLLAHFGDSYNCKSENEITEVYQNSLKELLILKDKLSAYCEDIMISIGDTPTCSIINDFIGVDEIRPGNFVFYDSMQYQLGSCSFDSIAVAVACPIVAKHKERDEIVIYGGSLHLSKDYYIDSNSIKSYGIIAPYSMKWDKYFENSYVKSISQEHGIISIDKKYMDKIDIGGIVLVIPAHSCLTSNLLNDSLII